MDRRRFIQIVAASTVASGARAKSLQQWTGRAMGAEVSLTLHGATRSDLEAAKAAIHAAEARFSIYDPSSELSRLNASGHAPVSAELRTVLDLCDHICRATDGLFDPTVQPVFAALAHGKAPPWHLVGWPQVRRTGAKVTLGKGQALTLNGIAQGVATDWVKDVLARRGLTQALVSVGEHAAIGGPFRLSLEDPKHGRIGTRTLTDGAIATSSPPALRIGDHSHILHPRGAQVRWSTVSVEATSAALADGASTALCLASQKLVHLVAERLKIKVTVVDPEGDVARFG